jgi:hypothetical protein
LPLFGGKKKPSSIRDVPDWEKVVNSLTARIGEEYEVASSQLPLGIFGKSEYEIIRDKDHRTVVYPSLLNSKWKFHTVHFIDEALGKLDVGFAPDGTGMQAVGTRRSFVNRKFVDGFVGCVSDVYNTSWETIHVWALGPTRTGAAPIFLVSESLTMSVSPYLFGDQHFEPTGKYEYAQPGFARN